VYDFDRLGEAEIVLRDYPKAEAAYRRALVIRESLYGKNHADLIATVDGLAYAVFGQKKYDEAEPIYQRLVELWESSVGEDHPMLAMALDKIVIFYADQKKYEQAKAAADRATAIRTVFLANGLWTAGTEQLAEGHPEDAKGLYRRALKVMDPPHPLYDELRQKAEEFLASMEAQKQPTKKAAAKKK
jgi:tetratricopeptide (TPR) repeat protein